MRDAQFRNGYLACDQNLPRSNFTKATLNGIKDTRTLRRDPANQAWSIEILLMKSDKTDKTDKINTQDWNYCWVAFTYAPSFYFHLENLMNCLRSILWPNLASSRNASVKFSWSHCLDNWGQFCSKGWNIFLAMEWMKTKPLCKTAMAI